MLTFMTNMHGVDQDLTPYVSEATWQQGSKQQNYFGQLADPAEGSLKLWNQGGEFRTFAPASWVDPTPGPDVWIEHQGSRLFTGKSAFIVNELGPSSANDSADMPLLGPLAYLNRFSTSLFATLDGDLNTSAVWDLVLDAAGYTGGRLKQSGLTTLSAIRINQASLLGSAEERIDFLAALRTIIQAEVGRGYDNRHGHVVFRNRQGRSNFWATTTSFTLDHSNARIEQAEIGNVLETIVNQVSAPFDEFTGQGQQAITFLGISLPTTYSIPSGGTTLRLFVDISGFTAFIKDWAELTRGVDYTYTLPNIDPILEFSPATPAVHVPNPTNAAQEFVLTQVRGDPQRVTSQTRLDVESADSISAYGPRPVIYPADILQDPAEIADHLNWCVRLHDGIDPQGNKNLNEVRALDVHVNLRRPDNAGLIGIDIDALCYVTEPRLGLVSAPVLGGRYCIFRVRRPAAA